jgi:DNA-directed RNA polymerase subunit RPC12/RpoP
MTSAPSSYEVVCPHCKKPFRGELLGGEDERHRGFKCPHCRLFVPYERASEQDLDAPATTS